MKQLKALFINPGTTAYGSGQSMLGLLEKREFEAEVVCPTGGPLGAALQKIGVRIYPLEFGKHAFFTRPDWQLSFYRRLRHIIGESKPDALVVNLDGNTPLVTLASIRAGVPIIRFSRFEFKPPGRWIDRWCWLRASAIICPSDLVKRQVLSWIPCELRSRVHRWYDPHSERPVSDDEVKQFRERFALHQAKVVSCVGRLHPLKQIDIAIRAIGQVRHSEPNVRLLIIGSHDGSASARMLEHNLRKLVTQLGLENNVSFVGYMDRNAVPVAMASSIACVLPSKSESFGMVLTEAWSVMVPTVASDVGGCREISRASGGGLLHPPGDYMTLADQLLKLMTDPLMAKRHGQAGADWVKANCDATAYAVRFAGLLGQVSASRRPSGITVCEPPVCHETPRPTAATGTGDLPTACIATFYHQANPGANLQAYALSRVLGRMGIRAEMIDYRRPARDAAGQSVRQKVAKIVTQSKRRDAYYADFRQRFLKESLRTYLSLEDIQTTPPQAAAYICGSDQIWNPMLLSGGRLDPAYFLQFGSPDIPRFSYAASMGGYVPDVEVSSMIRECLKNYSYVSVREPRAQKYLAQLLGREVALSMDPTLLIDDYSELLDSVDDTQDRPDRYVMVYALQQTATIASAASRVADTSNLPVYSYGGPALPWKVVGRRVIEHGPIEWLRWIKGAETLVTNSFHGLVFGLLFRRRVIVVPLEGALQSRNERLVNLCELLGIGGAFNPHDVKRAAKTATNWDAVFEKLQYEREVSCSYLKRAVADIGNS